MDEVETSDDVITKSDISELTKAIDDLSKGLASHFARLTTPHPQSLGGHKAKHATNTLKKDEDESEEPDIQKGDEDVKKSFDVELDSIQKSYDAKLAALEEKISKMSEQKIEKAQAVIIPELLEKNDPILSNTAIFAGMGRTAK